MAYKFKKGDIVFLNTDFQVDKEKRFKIKSCKIESGEILYTLKESYYLTTPCYLFNVYQKIKHYLLHHNKKFKPFFFQKERKIIKFYKDEYNVGFKNYPRMDNWIQEDRLIKTPIPYKPITCSFNGCQIVNDFLNAENVKAVYTGPGEENINDFLDGN